MYPTLLCLPFANACCLLSIAVTHQGRGQREKERVSFCLQVTLHHREIWAGIWRQELKHRSQKSATFRLILSDKLSWLLNTT